MEYLLLCAYLIDTVRRYIKNITFLFRRVEAFDKSLCSLKTVST